jgi:hypothetical protein
MQYYTDPTSYSGFESAFIPTIPQETEEERRKRLEREAQQTVSTQTVETAADGTQTVTSKQTVPSAPVMPTVAQPAAAQQMTPQAVQPQPIAPQDVFGRMIQAESGGRQFDAQGRILTSPAGAQGIAQIMPATAAQPGFGIKPATPEEIATKEGNLAFGDRYFQGMMNFFKGDQVKAVAAYNAGPGKIQQAERTAQLRGGSWTDYIPRETIQYLGNIFGNMIPSAQAATLPQPQAGAGRGTLGMPQAVPGEGVAVATGQGVQGTMTVPEAQPAAVTQPAQAQPAAAAQPPRYSLDQYISMQDDPIQMIAEYKDPNTPAAIKKLFGDRLRDTFKMETETGKATQQAQQLMTSAGQGDRKSANTIAKTLQQQEGSWLKMALLSFVSPTLAAEEAIKLGIGNKNTVIRTPDGKAALITVNAKGEPLKGLWADGKEMSQQEYITAFAAGAKPRELDIVGGSFVNDKTGEVGRMVSDKRTGETFIQTDTGTKPMTGFRPQSSTGTLGDMYARRQQELLQKLAMVGPEKVAAIVAEDEAVNGPLDARTKAAILQRSTQAAPNMGAIPGAPAAATQAQGGQAVTAVPPTAVTQGAGTGQAVTAVPPTAMPPAPATAPAAGGTIAERRRAAEAAKTQTTTEAKEAGEDIGTVRANIGKAQANADYLITKMDQLVKHPGFETSVGAQGPSYLFGLRDKPLPSALGGADARDWQTRAREVLGQSFLQAIENLRGMGALSNAEGAAATTAIQRLGYIDPVTQLPVITAGSEEEFRSAVTDFQNVIKRSIDRNLVKLGRESKYGTKPESELAAEQQDKSKPAKEMTPAERAKAELEKRRKERQ